MASVSGILLITCADQPGLVAAVAGFVNEHGGNIVHADQHTDHGQRVFLQRVEFELDRFDLAREAIAPAFAPLAGKFGMQWRLEFSDNAPRVAILASKLGHCVYDLLARWRLHELRIRIPLIISNHPDLQPIADDFGIAYHHLPATRETKAQQEQEIEKLLVRHDIDLVVLARYMQVLGRGLVRRYSERMINIHHSFLPAFAGARPYHQAAERGVKIIGATAHYVTEDLDQGPIIEQDVVHVSHRDTVRDMIRKGRDLERVVLARALARHVEWRVLVYRNKTVVFD